MTLAPQLSIGVVNQSLWPKAGDVDDCAALATMQAALAVAPWLPMPTITRFREAAGNPDNLGEPDGHTIQQCARAIRILWPALGALVEVSAGTLTKAHVLEAIAGGRVALLFVKSSALPADQQYGWAGGHAIAAAPAYRIANPLAPAHSRWKGIGADRLGEAIRQFPGDRAQAILMPTVAEAFTTHPLYVVPGTPDADELAAARNEGRLLEFARQRDGATVNLVPLEG